MNHLGLFAKYWQPGHVKTRLAAGIGPGPASQVYLHFLNHLMQELGQTGDVRTIGYTPQDRKQEFARLTDGGNWQLVKQDGSDLGARMRSFFDWAFKQSAPPKSTNVILIGSDTPHLSPTTVQRAFELLEQTQIVLGPSTDGGYYLIGMNQACPQIFADVSWSTSSVFEQTINNLERLNVSFEQLHPMTDIDELDDLVELKMQLENDPASSSQNLLSAINAVEFQVTANE